MRIRKPRWLDAREVRRWLTLRCEHCGHRFRWKRDGRHSFGNRDGKVYHGPCMSYLHWRSKAEERLEVVDVATELAGLCESDIKEVAKLRAPEDQQTAVDSKVWRVFYDLEQSHAETSDRSQP